MHLQHTCAPENVEPNHKWWHFGNARVVTQSGPSRVDVDPTIKKFNHIIMLQNQSKAEPKLWSHINLSAIISVLWMSWLSDALSDRSIIATWTRISNLSTALQPLSFRDGRLWNLSNYSRTTRTIILALDDGHLLWAYKVPSWIQSWFKVAPCVCAGGSMVSKAWRLLQWRLTNACCEPF